MKTGEKEHKELASFHILYPGKKNTPNCLCKLFCTFMIAKQLDINYTIYKVRLLNALPFIQCKK